MDLLHDLAADGADAGHRGRGRRADRRARIAWPRLAVASRRPLAQRAAFGRGRRRRRAPRPPGRTRGGGRDRGARRPALPVAPQVAQRPHARRPQAGRDPLRGPLAGRVARVGGGRRRHQRRQSPFPDELAGIATTLAERFPAVTPDAGRAGGHRAASRAATPPAERLAPAELAALRRRDWLRGRRLRAPAAGTGVPASPRRAPCSCAPTAAPSWRVRAGTVELADRSLRAVASSHASHPRHRQHRDHRRASSRATRSRRTGGSPPIPTARPTSGPARSAASSSRADIRRTRSRPCASRRWRRRSPRAWSRASLRPPAAPASRCTPGRRCRSTLDVDEPLTVGADRIVNVLAAVELYHADIDRGGLRHRDHLRLHHRRRPLPRRGDHARSPHRGRPAHPPHRQAPGDRAQGARRA